MALVVPPAVDASSFMTRWPSDYVPLKIDSASFNSTNFGGTLALSPTEARKWVLYAASQWRHRTSADFSIDYQGDSTSQFNVVRVVPGCASMGRCDVAAETIQVNGTSGVLWKTVTIYGGSFDWEVVQSQISSSEVDLVGVLVHEMGHYIGLNHSPNSVMRPELFLGTAHGRAPVESDIEAMRAEYGTTTAQRYWQEYNGTSFSGVHSFGYPTPSVRTAAAIGGKTGSGAQWIASSAPSMSGNSIEFRHAQYPLTPSSTWYVHWRSASTHQSPAIASNGKTGSDARWVAAYFQKGAIHETPHLSNTRLVAHLVILVSKSPYFLTGPSTEVKVLTGVYGSAYPPSVAYDPVNGYFYILYADHYNHTLNTKYGELSYIRNHESWVLNPTIQWQPPVPLGVLSLDSPSLVCGLNSKCVASYPRASAKNPTNVHRAINASPSGLTLSTYNETANSYFQHTSNLGYYKTGSGSYSWFTAYQRNSGADDMLANGRGRFWFSFGNGMPPGQSIIINNGTWLTHPLAIASSPNTTSVYLLHAYGF